MADDWKPGDLALCVKSTKLVGAASGLIQDGPLRGKIYEVRDVKLFYGSTIGLGIDGFIGWVYSGLFRKIHPHTPDAEDRETIELLNKQPVEA